MFYTLPLGKYLKVQHYVQRSVYYVDIKWLIVTVYYISKQEGTNNNIINEFFHYVDD